VKVIKENLQTRRKLSYYR